MTPTDGAVCQSEILPSLLATGRAGVQANTPSSASLELALNFFFKSLGQNLKKKQMELSLLLIKAIIIKWFLVTISLFV